MPGKAILDLKDTETVIMVYEIHLFRRKLRSRIRHKFYGIHPFVYFWQGDWLVCKREKRMAVEHAQKIKADVDIYCASEI